MVDGWNEQLKNKISKIHQNYRFGLEFRPSSLQFWTLGPHFNYDLMQNVKWYNLARNNNVYRGFGPIGLKRYIVSWDTEA